jgi:hypothetical protein
MRIGGIGCPGRRSVWSWGAYGEEPSPTGLGDAEDAAGRGRWKQFWLEPFVLGIINTCVLPWPLVLL